MGFGQTSPRTRSAPKKRGACNQRPGCRDQGPHAPWSAQSRRRCRGDAARRHSSPPSPPIDCRSGRPKFVPGRAAQISPESESVPAAKGGKWVRVRREVRPGTSRARSSRVLRAKHPLDRPGRPVTDVGLRRASAASAAAAPCSPSPTGRRPPTSAYIVLEAARPSGRTAARAHP
jgi:hypothetical protein